MMRIHWLRLAVVGVAAAIVSMMGQAQAQQQAQEALNAVSSDAEIVFIIPRLDQFSQKLAMLNAELQIDSPDLNDPLTQFKVESGMTEGVRDNGPLVIVLKQSLAQMAGGEPQMFMLMPVTDYAAFVGNFDGDAQAEVAELAIPTGQMGFARQLDGFALLGADRESVAAYQPEGDATAWTGRAGALGGQYLTGSDAAILVHLPPMRQDLFAALGMAQMMAGAMLGGADPDEAQQMQASLQSFFAAAQAVVRDGSAIVIAVDVSDVGIGTTISAQFENETEIAGKLAGGGEGADSFLGHLPDRPFLAVMSVDARSFDLEALNRFIKPFMMDTPELAEAYAEFDGIFAPLQGTSMAVYPATEGDEPIFTTYARTEDAAGYVEATQRYITQLDGLAIDAFESGHFRARFAPNQMQIGDVSVHELDVSMDMPDMPMDMNPFASLTEQRGYIAATGNHVVQTNTRDMALLQEALAAADQGNALGTQGVIPTMRQALTPKPAAELFLDLHGFAELLMGPQAGPKPGLLAASVSIDRGGIAGRWLVPIDLAAYLGETMPLLLNLAPGGFDDFDDDDFGFDDPF